MTLEEEPGADMDEDKREEPEYVTPVVLGDVRFEAPHFGDDVGVGQDGGILAAFALEGGTLLWTLIVYANDPANPDEDSEIYIQGIRALEDGKTLCIVNEHGAEFRVDIETRAVTPVAICAPET